MRVTVEVVGEDTREVDVGVDATYADLARAVGYSHHEVSVLVDGTPVPADRAVDADRVQVLRLVKGGSSGASPGPGP
jgi:sulfur carrier protein